MSAALTFTWDGSAMVPIDRHRGAAAEIFEEGKRYDLEPVSDRSRRSHDHYFACLNAAFDNLPEAMRGMYLDVDHMRKRALIACGYATEKLLVLETSGDALRVGHVMGELDRCAVIVISDKMVRHLTAESQSLKAMKKARFEQSKHDVLAWCAEQIGVSVDELEQTTRQAA